MRKQLRLLSVVIPFTMSSLVAAARLPESDARAQLEAQGLTAIHLVPKAGGFEWRANGARDAECSGTLTRRAEGRERWAMTRSCESR